MEIGVSIPNVYFASTFSPINNSAPLLLFFLLSAIIPLFSVSPFYPPSSSLFASRSLARTQASTHSRTLTHTYSATGFPSVSLFVFLSVLLFNESSRLTRALLLSNGCPLFTRLRNSLCLYNGCLTHWVVFAIDRSSPGASQASYIYCFSKNN